MKFGIRLRLIPQWRSFWRFWSVRFTAIGTALTTWLVNSPDAMLGAWNSLPLELRGYLPQQFTLYIAIGILVIGMFSRVIKQEKLPPAKENENVTY